MCTLCQKAEEADSAPHSHATVLMQPEVLPAEGVYIKRQQCAKKYKSNLLVTEWLNEGSTAWRGVIQLPSLAPSQGGGRLSSSWIPSSLHNIEGII